jgi:heterodisulfide reductase subunit A-like polyferredoxin
MLSEHCVFMDVNLFRFCFFKLLDELFIILTTDDVEDSILILGGGVTGVENYELLFI